jgi:predicted nucleotidyltransferase
LLFKITTICNYFLIFGYAKPQKHKNLKKILAIAWLQTLKQKIKEVEPSAEIILYGSRARNTAKKHSDWDFLVLSDQNIITSEIEKQFRLPFFMLELELNEVLSLQVFSKTAWENTYKITPYYQNIKKEGIIL